MIRPQSPILLISVLLGASGAAAQEPSEPPPRTVHAVRLAEPLRIDGRLDEEFYATSPPTSDFVQVEPEEGAPATEKTELWIAFDDDNIYISFRCWESQPERVTATEMRRDVGNMWRGDDIDLLDVRHLPRPPQRVRVRAQPDRRAPGCADGERAAVDRRLEHDLGLRYGSVRERVDRRGGDSLQVAALQAG